MAKDPWDVPAWRANCEALQTELAALVERARGLGCSLEYLTISDDGEDTLEAVGMDVAPADGCPTGGGVFARFFPDPWLLDENFHPGVVPDEVCEAYGRR